MRVCNCHFSIAKVALVIDAQCDLNAFLPLLAAKLNVKKGKGSLFCSAYHELVISRRWRSGIASGMAGWIDGSALVSINEVTLRRVWLVVGWVTVCWRVNHKSL